LGIPDRQRLEEERVDDREDRRVDANTEGESEDRYGSKARVLHQHPHAETDVLQSGLAQPCTPNIAAFLAHVLHIAKTPACDARRFAWGHAFLNVLRRAHFDMEAQLIINFLLHCSPPPERTEPLPGCSE